MSTQRCHRVSRQSTFWREDPLGAIVFHGTRCFHESAMETPVPFLKKFQP